ncbi:MAG: hypothetical protein JWO83_401 [Caulobacteraceae bacterium]|nr:hypothetical protein [Caulobacteraceae bacterium]
MITRLTLFAALAVALAGAARPAETIRPGYWESTDRVLSPIRSTKVDRRCIAQKDVEKFMTCYINHHYSCVCPEQSYENGQIRYRGVCTDSKGGRVGIVGRGAYTPTTLHLDADVTFHLAGIPITGQASTDAHRIADDCPAEAEAK